MYKHVYMQFYLRHLEYPPARWHLESPRSGDQSDFIVLARTYGKLIAELGTLLVLIALTDFIYRTGQVVTKRMFYFL